MEKPEEKAPMPKFIPGTDRGNAFMTALILIIILSSLFIALISRIQTMRRFTNDYRANVIGRIEESNREIINAYDSN